MDIIDIVLSKKYTDESLKGITGTLAGKNCTIKSATKVDGVTTVVFAWTANDGTEKTTAIQVNDGNNDYEDLINMPKIEGVELIGNKTFEDLGIASATDLAQTDEYLQNLADLVGDKANLPMPNETVVGNIKYADTKIDSLKDDLVELANATTNYDDEENEEDVDTTEIIGMLIFTSNYLHINTGVTNSGRVLKCPVSKGEKYRVVCSYSNSIYTVGYGLTQSDDHTTDIYYFDSNATSWRDNQIFDVEVGNDGYLYAYGRKNYNVSIKKLVSTRVYTSKSYDKETTDTKYIQNLFLKKVLCFFRLMP